MEVAQINAALEAVYQEAYEPLRAGLPPDPIVSYPLFLRVPPAYADASLKLLVVGQQTRGWRPDDGREGTRALLDQYQSFDLAKDYRHKSSPFWRAAHELFSLTNLGGRERAFLWTNLVRVDEGGDRPRPEVEEMVSRFPLLEAEIRFTKPQAVVFFTGPAYDARLRQMFPEVKMEAVTPTIFKLRHPKLPLKSYRTYHPNYLQRSKQWNTVSDLAAQIFKEQP